MVLPLLPIIAGAGLATSAGANLYKTWRSRQLYDQLGKGYSALDKGYRSHLSRHGRRINPNRALTSYYGQYLRSRTNSDLALGTAVGSTAGTIGAGSMIGAKTWRMFK